MADGNSGTPLGVYKRFKPAVHNVRKTDFGFTADLRIPGTLAMLGIDASDRPPDIVKATMDVWITNGIPTRIERHLVTANPANTITRVTQLMFVGSTRIDVPDDIRASLGLTLDVAVAPLTPAEHPSGKVPADYADLQQQLLDTNPNIDAMIPIQKRLCDESKAAMGERSRGYIENVLELAEIELQGMQQQAAVPQLARRAGRFYQRESRGHDPVRSDPRQAC